MTAQQAPCLDRDVQSDIGSRLRRGFDVTEGDLPFALARLLDALRECETGLDGETRQPVGALS